jgi:fucose permease
MAALAIAIRAFRPAADHSTASHLPKFAVTGRSQVGSEMTGLGQASDGTQLVIIKIITCLMFFLFAMTTDAVGSVIPEVIKEFHLSLTAAGTFHYVPMAAIAAGALLLGFLADRLGRKTTIVLGLILYAIGSGLFSVGSTFGFFVILMALSGLGISVFKIGALALVGDVTKSSTDHTSLMNTLEGFFAVGSIVGPAVVAILSATGMSWKWLYVAAAALCLLLIVAAFTAKYPTRQRPRSQSVALKQTFLLFKDPFAVGFSFLIALYVSVEVAIYVWMPTYLRGYDGALSWLSTYALTLFFVLRAAGRFLGAWLLRHLSWTAVSALCGALILGCFGGSLFLGVRAGIVLLPLSGLFMSTIYPTLNSKGISCFGSARHGAVAGIILFFTAGAAAVSPLAMAAVSDHFGSVFYGFGLATLFSLLLFLGLLANWILDPTKRRLLGLDRPELREAAIKL